MPNWCANHITIEGPKEKVKDLYDVAMNGDGLLSAMCPIGKWDYHDALNSWGTKWDVSLHETNIEFIDSGSNGLIHGYFESAWSPPEQACLNYLDKNQDMHIELHYYEPAMDFCGSLNEGTIKISEQHLDFWKNDPSGIEIDNHFDVQGMLEEMIEEEQQEALGTPPDLISDI